MIARIIFSISIVAISFALGFILCAVITPKIGTLTIDQDEEKDTYTILLNKDPNDLGLKNDGLCYLKIHYLARKKNTSYDDRLNGQKGD